MSKNIKQIFDANPATSMDSTDLLYLGRSPYNTSDDFAITFSNFSASIGGVTPTQVQQSAFNIAADTGVADAYVVDLSPTVSSYTDGLIVIFSPAHTNATGTPTLQVNGLAAVSIFPINYFVATLVPGDINASQELCVCIYSTIASGFILLNPWFSNTNSQMVQFGLYNDGTDSGIADAYVVTNSNLPANSNSTIGEGAICALHAANANTTSTPTLSFQGSTPRTITLLDGSPLQANDILANVTAICFSVNSGAKWLLLNPQVSIINALSIQQSIFNVGTDTGAADAYSVALTPAVGALTNGLLVAFTPANTNLTTTPTLNVGTGATNIFNMCGSTTNALLPGDLWTGQIAYLIYSSALSGFILLNPAISIADTQDVQLSNYNVGGDTGAADAYVVNLYPVLGGYVPGLEVAFTPTHDNATTTPTLKVNGNPAVTIALSNGPVQAGDLSTTMIAKCIYNSGASNFILLTPAVS